MQQTQVQNHAEVWTQRPSLNSKQKTHKAHYSDSKCKITGLQELLEISGDAELKQTRLGQHAILIYYRPKRLLD